MNREAFQQLTRVLSEVRDVKPQTFRMDTWYDTNELCGSTGCAIGHAMCDPWFIKQGFMANHEEEKLPDLVIGELKYFDDDIFPSFAGHARFGAIAEFFGITYRQAYDLFGASTLRGADGITKVLIQVGQFVEWN
jgi:hypothetical protein